MIHHSFVVFIYGQDVATDPGLSPDENRTGGLSLKQQAPDRGFEKDAEKRSDAGDGRRACRPSAVQARRFFSEAPHGFTDG
jgi:hypothetical protein